MLPYHAATVACPMDQVEFKYPNSCCQEEFLKSILVTLSRDLTAGVEIRNLLLGPFRSYIGSEVVEEVIKSPIGDIPKTRTNGAARRLAIYYLGVNERAQIMSQRSSTN